jgi:hypothetical protein
MVKVFHKKLKLKAKKAKKNKNLNLLLLLITPKKMMLMIYLKRLVLKKVIKNFIVIWMVKVLAN